MIFVTVGTQLPFERLIEALDVWAQRHPHLTVFAQVGETQYQAQHIECVKGLTPKAYQEKFSQATLVVSHVGMGTIISGLSAAKPMVLMPRKAALGEHRNDHQLATARKFDHFSLIDIVQTPDELYQNLDRRLHDDQSYEGENLTVSDGLVTKLQAFIDKVKADAL